MVEPGKLSVSNWWSIQLARVVNPKLAYPFQSANWDPGIDMWSTKNMRTMRATLALDTHDTIGEGPTWVSSAGRIIWTDNAIGLVHEARSDGAGSWRESRSWMLNRITGAAVPRAKGGFVVASGTDLLTLDEAGVASTFTSIDDDPSVVKLNDARCDPQGRLWSGTFTHDFSPGRGALYRFDPDGSVTTILREVGLSNGLDWSPDGGTFYYIDSMRRSVDAFDFDPFRGSLSRRRTIVSVPFGEGSPDGMTVDSEGRLWVAVFGAAEVRQYTPDGELLSRVEISAPAVTSCAFGGSDRQELFITSGALPLPEGVARIIGCSAEMARIAHTAKGAGGLFVCRPGATGKPTIPFAG